MTHIIICPGQVDVESVLRGRWIQNPDKRMEIHHCRTEQELAAVLERAARLENPAPFFTFSSRTGRISCPYSEIVYVRAGQHSFQLFLADGSEVSSRTIRCSFARAMQPLLECGYFLYCERSMVVNLHYVKRVQDTGLLLYNGTLLPYPTSRRKRYPLPGELRGKGDN